MKPMFSDAWYRVAELRLSLRAQVRIHRHTYRGQRWHVVQDLTSGQFLRFDALAYRAISLMDGVRTVDEIWKALLTELGDEAPSQDALLRLFTQLYQANLLRSDQLADAMELAERGRRNRWNRIKSMLQNPLSMRIPLWSPDAAVGAAVAWIPPWLWRVLMMAWLLLIATGLATVAVHWDALTEDLSAQAFTPAKILGLALIFPFLKVIHELGHCIAIKALGGTVHELGVMFLVFVPIPYVDASQSYTFSSKWQRMLVGAAGMLIEMGVAAIAALLWVDASGGLFKSVMHQILLLASVSTVVFNANPLLRFDGYYILADWLEIPNLAKRANELVKSWCKRRLFGMEEAPTRETLGEIRWMVPYAIASHAYRLVVTFTIVLLVAENYLAVGIVLAAWSLWNSILSPIGKFLRFLTVGSQLLGHRRRAMVVTVLLTSTLATAMAAVPLPSSTQAQGVLWAKDAARVVVPTSCFGERFLVEAGQEVRAGDALMVCSDPQYQAQVAIEEFRVLEARRKASLARTTDRVQWAIAQRQVQLQEDLLAQARQRAQETVIVSPHDGRFVPSSTALLRGRYLQRGELLGHVVASDLVSLMVVVDQAQIDRVRMHLQGVEARLVQDVWQEVAFKVVREVPAGSRELPSMALSIQGGGDIGLDPSQANAESRPVALDHFFQFEMLPLDGQLPAYIGSRVYVRFEHPAEPVAYQWYRQARQMFIRRFSI